MSPITGKSKAIRMEPKGTFGWCRMSVVHRGSPYLSDVSSARTFAFSEIGNGKIKIK